MTDMAVGGAREVSGDQLHLSGAGGDSPGAGAVQHEVHPANQKLIKSIGALLRTNGASIDGPIPFDSRTVPHEQNIVKRLGGSEGLALVVHHAHQAPSSTSLCIDFIMSARGGAAVQKVNLKAVEALVKKETPTARNLTVGRTSGVSYQGTSLNVLSIALEIPKEV